MLNFFGYLITALFLVLVAEILIVLILIVGILGAVAVRNIFKEVVLEDE